MDEFIARLDEQRVALGLSHQDFARRIGCDPTLWWRARRGQIRLSGAVIRGALREFPELAPFLADAFGTSEDSAERGDRHETEVAAS